MQDLSLIEIAKNAIKSMLDSQVFVLFIFEAIVLLLAIIFKHFMNKKIVIRTCIFTSIIILGLYISNYITTLITVINNVTTRFIEFIYFPTTLEFVVVMVISFTIMIITLINKKSSKIVKFINSALPICISFLFLSIIEYINKTNIEFNEFSVFTDPILTSLYELAMGLFLAWIVGLILYKIDMYVINKVSSSSVTEDLVTVDLSKLDQVDDIEMPKLKQA